MPPKATYRITWEGVGTDRLWLYMDHDPRAHTTFKQTVPNASIPEADWRPVTTESTDDPWQMYNQMRRWELSGYGFIRNVKLLRYAHDGWKQWTGVED